MRLWTCAALLTGAVALVCAAAAAEQKPAPKRLTDQNHLAIVRSFVWEFATARQPMPAAKELRQGLVIEASGGPAPAEAPAGKVNQDKLRQDLAARGAVVHTGDVVQITAVQFRPDRILFEINGGGVKKKKWYEHIQVEAGPGVPVGGDVSSDKPAPDKPGSYPPGTGSWILLTFSGDIPDVTPEQVKQMLAGALDFTRRSPSVPWIETIPEEFREAVKQKKAIVGMNREMVLAALGRPERKIRETKNGREQEDWIFGQPPFVTFVTFVEDQVVEVKEFR